LFKTALCKSLLLRKFLTSSSCPIIFYYSAKALS
jgi:hypothetical protein